MTIFLPGHINIGVDCSNLEALKNVQEIASNLPILETYKKIILPFKEIVLTGLLTLRKSHLPCILQMRFP